MHLFILGNFTSPVLESGVGNAPTKEVIGKVASQCDEQVQYPPTNYSACLGVYLYYFLVGVQ